MPEDFQFELADTYKKNLPRLERQTLLFNFFFR